MIKKLSKLCTNSAFTLAEVLIAVGIIGVIAAITIPNLISKNQEESRIVALKKTYSVLNSAIKLAIIDNGSPQTWGFTSGTGATGQKILADVLAPYLKVSDSGTIGGSYYTLILLDGTIIKFWIVNGSCNATEGSGAALSNNVCAELWVVVKPETTNVFGKNVFWFWMNKTGLVPIGSPQDTNYTFPSDCSRTNLGTNPGTDNNGRGCTAWVLYNQNMDYLDCDGLSWSGARTCEDL